MVPSWYHHWLKGQCIVFIFVMNLFKFFTVHSIIVPRKLHVLIVTNDAHNQNAAWTSSIENKVKSC